MAEFPAAVGALTGAQVAVVGDVARFAGRRVIVNTTSGEVARAADIACKKIGTNVDFYLDKGLTGAGVQGPRS